MLWQACDVRLVKKNLWHWFETEWPGPSQTSSLWCSSHFRYRPIITWIWRGSDPEPLPSTDKKLYFRLLRHQKWSIPSTHIEGTQRHSWTDELLAALCQSVYTRNLSGQISHAGTLTIRLSCYIHVACKCVSNYAILCVYMNGWIPASRLASAPQAFGSPCVVFQQYTLVLNVQYKLRAPPHFD